MYSWSLWQHCFLVPGKAQEPLPAECVFSSSAAGSRDCWTSFPGTALWFLPVPSPGHQKRCSQPLRDFFILNNAWIGYWMWIPLWVLYFSISLSVCWFLPPFPCDSILCLPSFFPSLHQIHHWFNQGWIPEQNPFCYPEMLIFGSTRLRYILCLIVSFSVSLSPPKCIILEPFVWTLCINWLGSLMKKGDLLWAYIEPQIH